MALMKTTFRIYVLLHLFIFTLYHLHAGFIAGTPIATASGPIAIEKLTQRSLVCGYDQIAIEQPNTQIITTKTDTVTQLYKITTDRGIITATADQLFFDTVQNAFVTAATWKLDSVFLTKAVQHLPTISVEKYTTQPTTTYDLGLASPHLFFSGEAQVLTHNNPAIAAMGAINTFILMHPELVEKCVEMVPLAISLMSFCQSVDAFRNSQVDNDSENCIRIPTPLLVPSALKKLPEPVIKAEQCATPYNQNVTPANIGVTPVPVAKQVTTAAQNTTRASVSSPAPVHVAASPVLPAAVQAVPAVPAQPVFAKPLPINDMQNSDRFYYPTHQSQIYQPPSWSDINVSTSINNQRVSSYTTNSPFSLNIDVSTQNTQSIIDTLRERHIADVKRHLYEWLTKTCHPEIYTMQWFIENTASKASRAGANATDNYFFNNFEDFRYAPYLQALRQSPNYARNITKLKDKLSGVVKGWFSNSTVGKNLDKKFNAGEGYLFFYQGKQVSLSELIQKLAGEIDSNQQEKIRKQEVLDDALFNNFEAFAYDTHLNALRQSPHYEQRILELQDKLQEQVKGWLWNTTVGKNLDKKFHKNQGYVFSYKGKEVSVSQLIDHLAGEIEAKRQAALYKQAELAQQQALAEQKAQENAVRVQEERARKALQLQQHKQLEQQKKAERERLQEKKFIRYLAISNPEKTVPAVATDSLAELITGEVIDYAPSCAKSKQQAFELIELYEKVLFDLTPGECSIDQQTATTLESHGPQWVTAEIQEDGNVLTTVHQYRLTSYDADTKKWSFVLDSIPHVIERTNAAVSSFVAVKEKDELGQMREHALSWPREMREELKICWPKRTGEQFKYRYSLAHKKKLDYEAKSFAFSPQAVLVMLERAIAPSSIAHTLCHGELVSIKQSELAFCFDEKNDLIMLLDSQASRVVSIGNLKSVKALRKVIRSFKHADQASLCEALSVEIAGQNDGCIPDHNNGLENCGTGTRDEFVDSDRGSCLPNSDTLADNGPSGVNEPIIKPQPCSWDSQLPPLSTPDKQPGKEEVSSVGKPPPTVVPTEGDGVALPAAPATEKSPRVIEVVKDKKEISRIKLTVPSNPTAPEKTDFIDHEFELGIEKFLQDDKTFNFTSNLELSLEEAEKAAFHAIKKQLAKNPGFKIVHDNQYRWEASKTEINGNETEITTLRYRYPLAKRSGPQIGLLVGNIEYEIELKNISEQPSTKKIIKANLHLEIKK